MSPEVDEAEGRWSIGHAIGHRVMHPGNHLWLRARTLLATPFEREAEHFAHGLLVDKVETMTKGLTTAGEFAEYFGVLAEMVRVQGRLCWGQRPTARSGGWEGRFKGGLCWKIFAISMWSTLPSWFDRLSS